jgi:glycosyltransferase involved in cell wall biosynthesis
MIAFAHYSSEQDISGVTTWLVDFLRFLRGKGEEVCVNLHHFGTEVERASVLVPLRAAGVEVSIRRKPHWSGEAVRDDLEFLNRHRPAVFLPQCLPAHFFAARLAARAGVRCALVLHSDDPEYWALLDSSVPERWDGVVVGVSEAIAAESRRRKPGADVRVIPCGVPIPSMAARWSPERFRVVYSGRMVERQKSVALVLDTLIGFCRNCAVGEAVLIGDGPELAVLKARVAEAGLDSRIRFTGRLAPAEVGPELAAGQAILLMSEFEGLPVAMLEGMACGLVPVARQMRSGIPEIVRDGETGLLLSDDPSAAAESLIRLAADSERWERLSAGARGLVRTSYLQEACFERWWSVIRELQGAARPVYPLAMPSRGDLPPPDERLGSVDLREPTLLKRGVGWGRRHAGRVLRKLGLRRGHRL